MFPPSAHSLIARLTNSRQDETANSGMNFDLGSTQPMQIASAALQRLPAAIRGHVEAAAAKHGVDTDGLSRMVFIESGGDPSKRSPSGNHFGLLQLSVPLQKKYGVNNWRDPKQNIEGGIAHLKELVPLAAKAQGVQPGEVTSLSAYIMHQQGSTGGLAILAAAAKNDSRPAWKVIQETVNEARSRYGNKNLMTEQQAKSNVNGNVPSEYRKEFDLNTATAADFVNVWKKRFGPESDRPFLKPQS